MVITRGLNGFVTLFLAYVLYKIYSECEKKFYFYWSLGYVFYGINIVIRIFYQPSFSVETYTDLIVAFFAILFVGLGFTFMIIGVGELIMKPVHMLLATMILPLFPVLQIVTGHIFISLSMLSILLPYAFMVFSLLVINWKTSLDLNLLTIGWSILLFINVGFFSKTMDHSLVEVMSGFGKIVIYLGMTKPNFSYIVDDFRSFLLSGVPTEYLDTYTGGFGLVNLRNANRRKEVKWIEERAASNSKKGIRTILISLYDMITPNDFHDEAIRKELYFIRVIQGNPSTELRFGEGIMRVGEDLNKIDLLISDIFKFSNQNRLPCEVIIYTLSHLLHTHGWKRIYSYFTSKMPTIKNSKIKFTCFYYPETHEIRSDILKFETMADEVIQ
ncbi:MAG: hypothetical protein ACLFVP_02955 [Candidatus Bathyarchaeia archaeon]